VSNAHHLGHVSVNNIDNYLSTPELFLADVAATKQFGYELGTTLTAGTVLLLVGDLGSGKTSLIQGLAAGLGVTEAITSPTFTLINEYLAGRCPLYHLDLYRLTPAEVAALHLEQYWEGWEVEPGIVAIEWPERLPYRPAEYLQIELTHHPVEGRLAKMGSSQNSEKNSRQASTNC
jgi:tRNA threonylcarbamoyladenosine biosynthesis protein TsaE